MSAFLARLDRHVRETPDRPFCHFVTSREEQTFTWRDFGANTASYADHLARLVADPSRQVVLIFLKHTPHLYWAFFGAMRGGLVPSFMPCLTAKQNPAVYWRSHRALLDHIQPAAIISDAATFAEMTGNGLDLGTIPQIDIAGFAPAESATLGPYPSDQAVALLQHSSGTTGLKKGVALTSEAILSQLESYSAALSIDARDIIVSWLPLYHDMGLIACLLLPAYCGIPFVHTDPFHWLMRPGILFDQISRYRATLCWLPNFAFEHLARIVPADAAGDLGSVRAFINCSEPCKTQTFDRFLERFGGNGLDSTKLHVCYAMAEAVFAVTQTPLGRPPSRFLADVEALHDGRAVPASSMQGSQLLSTGPEINGIEVRVLGADREEVPDGTLGELAIRGQFLFSGYYGNAALSDQKFQGDLYCTGDLGFRHDGEVYVLGRVDDLIIVNGKNIVAHEIERMAPDAHADVKPGRVVAVPISHRDSGSDVLVLIAERIAGTSSPAAAMITAISDRVFSEIGVKPVDVRIVDEGWLLKTTSGKISRKDNRIRYLSEFAPRWSADTAAVDFARSK